MTISRNLSILAEGVNSSGVLTAANGGTGLATTPANGALDIGNGTGFTRTTLTQGTNIAITNGAGSISIAVSGTPSFATSVTTPIVYGGTTASSSLTLQSTSGVGTSDNILFKVGNNGATTAMTINTSGNVGIGTSSPGRLLVAYGASDTQIQATSTGVNSYFQATGSSGSTYFGAYGSGFGVLTSATLQLLIDSTGNVGIGTSSPVAKLHVNGNGSQLYLDNSSGGQYTTVYWLNAGVLKASAFWDNNATAFYFGTDVSAPLLFKTNSAERMRIDSTGNVGVGTSSPNASAILDAQSTTKGVRFPNMTTTQKNAVSSPAAGLVVFDTTLAKLCVYSGSAWQTITSV